MPGPRPRFGPRWPRSLKTRSLTPGWRLCSRTGFPSPIGPRWKSGCADPALPSGPRARLLFALAQVLDGRGDYDGAAECLREANALARELGSRPARVCSGRPRAVRRRPAPAFDRDFFARTGRRRARDAPAGVRLRPAAIGHDADRAGAGQPPAGPRRRRAAVWPGRLFEAIPGRRRRCRAPAGGSSRASTPTRFARLAEQHLERLAAIDGGRARGSWTRCPTTTCISACSPRMFPRAVFIHCRRDLRDVAVSCWMTDFRSIRWANDPDHIASRFREYRRLMDHWRDVLPVPIRRGRTTKRP